MQYSVRSAGRLTTSALTGPQLGVRGFSMSGMFDFDPNPSGGGVHTRIAEDREKKLAELDKRRRQKLEDTAKRKRQSEEALRQRQR